MARVTALKTSVLMFLKLQDGGSLGDELIMLLKMVIPVRRSTLTWFGSLIQQYNKKKTTTVTHDEYQNESVRV